jgi:hypothetical protein
VTDEPFFLTIAGISMSFAGFAGLMNALRRSETWEAMHLYQLRIIVAYAVATLFAALTAIPAAALFGQRDAVQWLGSAMFFVTLVLGVWNMRGDMRLREQRMVSTTVRAVFTALSLLGSFAFLLAALTGVMPVLELALVLMLSLPAGTFVYVVWKLER